jgi:hypothetical protein
MIKKGKYMNMDEICKHLRPILNNALENNNHVKEKSKGWSNADLVYDMSTPLNIKEISKLCLDKCVVFWANKDTYYNIQDGYYCNLCKHSIAGPPTK